MWNSWLRCVLSLHQRTAYFVAVPRRKHGRSTLRGRGCPSIARLRSRPPLRTRGRSGIARGVDGSARARLSRSGRLADNLAAQPCSFFRCSSQDTARARAQLRRLKTMKGTPKAPHERIPKKWTGFGILPSRLCSALLFHHHETFYFHDWYPVYPSIPSEVPV